MAGHLDRAERRNFDVRSGSAPAERGRELRVDRADRFRGRRGESHPQVGPDEGESQGGEPPQRPAPPAGPTPSTRTSRAAGLPQGQKPIRAEGPSLSWGRGAEGAVARTIGGGADGGAVGSAGVLVVGHSNR